MPAAIPDKHADILRRLDDLPMREHDRSVAKAQARLAFAMVDTLCDAFDDVVRALFAPPRRQVPR